MRHYRNFEGYIDPTAGAALARVIAEERRAKRQARYREYIDKNKTKCNHRRKNPEKEKRSSMNPYESLANAIILQAVKDYRTALACLKLNPSDVKAKAEAVQIEKFFRSQRYMMLSDVDGEFLIQKIREESRI